MSPILLFLLPVVVEAFNLAVDVNPRVFDRLLADAKPFFERRLDGHQIPLIEKQRCLGRIALAETTVTQATIEDVHAERVSGDYYLQLRHLHAKLHGNYKHNVLFVHQGGDFDLRVRDLNATIGPLVPVAVAGLPYIDSNVGCRVSHKEDEFDVHGGILRVIARKRLSETLETDLEALLCDSLTSLLDEVIRQGLGYLRLKTNINDNAVMSFYLSRPPLLLPSGAIRFYHDGVSSTERSNQFQFEVETLNITDHDVIVHVHQNLVTEALTAVCQLWETQVQGRTVRCESMKADFASLETTETILLNVAWLVDGEKNERNYNVRLLHSNRLVMFLRLKSEMLPTGSNSDEFRQDLYSALSEELKTNFELALPVPRGMGLEAINVLFGKDRIVLAASLAQ